MLQTKEAIEAAKEKYCVSEKVLRQMAFNWIVRDLPDLAIENGRFTLKPRAKVTDAFWGQFPGRN